MPFLVGRDEEIGLLRRRWEQTKEGLGQVVLLSGEAGIGKSSLVEALRAHVRAEGVPRLAFRCSPYHQNSALYPMITHIEHLLRWQRDDTPAMRLDKLEHELQGYGLPLQEVVPLLAALLSVPLHGRYPALTLPPSSRSSRRSMPWWPGWWRKPSASRYWWRGKTCTGPTRPLWRSSGCSSTRRPRCRCCTC